MTGKRGEHWGGEEKGAGGGGGLGNKQGHRACTIQDVSGLHESMQLYVYAQNPVQWTTREDILDIWSTPILHKRQLSNTNVTSKKVHIQATLQSIFISENLPGIGCSTRWTDLLCMYCSTLGLKILMQLHGLLLDSCLCLQQALLTLSVHSQLVMLAMHGKTHLLWYFFLSLYQSLYPLCIVLSVHP